MACEWPSNECTQLTVRIEASWTGQGELVRGLGGYLRVTKSYTVNSRYRFTYRDATATLSIAGVDSGPSWYATLFNGKSGDLFVCHTQC
jgi:hypothetical protein